ncbi:DUF4274 domain-containing protein [Massilia sp. NR 4-1]|uniref:DUF4274 domain-containing protein n=2 Tax=unclassified Massilia TaxID=2609279 RepID=UPI00067AA26D|nr:DUF4274 domain-containing protein [Massilia sp. NR 4-1]AKU21529.1 hypothetical protein ACZ75_08650 [Massilia sp. NR 4-1]
MTEEQLEQQEWDIVRNYLVGATKAQRHIFAARANYDGNSEAFRWLVDSSETDQATALLLYWNLGAAWHVQFDSAEASSSPTTYQLLRLLEQRYKAGFYETASIYFDPHRGSGARPGDYPDIPVKLAIPDIMLRPVEGSEHVAIEGDPEGFDEGLPFDIAETIYALYR